MKKKVIWLGYRDPRAAENETMVATEELQGRSTAKGGCELAAGQQSMKRRDDMKCHLVGLNLSCR